MGGNVRGEEGRYGDLGGGLKEERTGVIGNLGGPVGEEIRIQ